MNADPRLAYWTRPTRTQALRDEAPFGLAAVIVLAAIGWRLSGAGGAIGAAIVGIIGFALVAWLRARHFDRRWLVAALDAARSDVEDSSDLLFADPATLGPLQRLQRERIEARIAASPVPTLAPPGSPRTRTIVVGAAILIATAMIAWPASEEAALAPATEGLPVIPGIPRLVAQRLDVVPPGYTGLPRRVLTTLDARVPAGSTVEWTLRFAPDPAGATLAPVGQPPIALERQREVWRAARRADRSLLYRVVPAGGEKAGVPPVHRIDIIADQPPRVRAETPRSTLTQLAPGQRFWALSFLATDDYGVAATARLRLVVAQGEGENVRFSERVLTLRGSGPPRARRFAARVDIATLGFDEPGDLVAQLTVADLRASAPQQVRGPSLILRRPPARPADGSGLEAMTRRVMPAYFRSQRQIIIDAEALLKERPRLFPDRFVARSDAIGDDQRLLRMRYGQFMGEETGGGATVAMPTNDDEDAPAGTARAEGDGHDQGVGPPPTPGSVESVTEAFGHTHDESEAATLLDPKTRATLRLALDNMWQSERALRQGDPRGALPYAYKALRFIKQVQQASRIFLPRTGSNLPQVDLSRRMTGERGAMGTRVLPSAAADAVDAAPAAIWRALDAPQPGPALDALSRWLAANASRIPDPLALAGAVDTLRRQPGCVRCRDAVRAALWPALPRPAPGLARRDGGDAVGRRYLDALP